MCFVKRGAFYRVEKVLFLSGGQRLSDRETLRPIVSPVSAGAFYPSKGTRKNILKKGIIKFLALGDIVSPGAVDALSERLWRFREENEIDFTAVNGENACIGNGLDPATAKRILASGADVITSGNHIWRKKEMHVWLDDGHPVLRPANYHATAPGEGFRVIDVCGYRALIINILGVVYMEPLENPIRCINRILDYMKGKYDFVVLDIHAEATSEKIAIGRCFDGRISAIYGTHTHVQTADECILPGGSGYITDLGMCGPDDSVLGVRTDIIIERLSTAIPRRFEFAEGHVTMHGAIFEIDTEDFGVRTVKRVCF